VIFCRSWIRESITFVMRGKPLMPIGRLIRDPSLLLHLNPHNPLLPMMILSILASRMWVIQHHYSCRDYHDTL